MSRYDDLSPEDKEELQLEFESSLTTRERKIEILVYLQEGADETKYLPPCPDCGHVPFHAPHHEALIEGHVYSRDGLKELNITGFCEYCFDKITTEPDEDWEMPT